MESAYQYCLFIWLYLSDTLANLCFKIGSCDMCYTVRFHRHRNDFWYNIGNFFCTVSNRMISGYGTPGNISHIHLLWYTWEYQFEAYFTTALYEHYCNIFLKQLNELFSLKYDVYYLMCILLMILFKALLLLIANLSNNV